jgi:hypothetical protein
VNVTERELVKRALDGWNRLHNKCYDKDLGTGATLFTDDRVYLDLQEMLKTYVWYVHFDGVRLLGPYDVEPILMNDSLMLNRDNMRGPATLARYNSDGWLLMDDMDGPRYKEMTIVKVLQE